MNIYLVHFDDDLKIEKYYHIFNLYDIAGYIAEISLYGYKLGEYYGTMYIDIDKNEYLTFSVKTLRNNLISMVRNNKINKLV